MSVHIIGAGLAGLAAACTLAETGEHIILSEAAPHAGGRARSYFDTQLGCRIDNGNHLLLSGNSAAMAFLARIGAKDPLSGPTEPIFPFHDLTTRTAWTLHLNRSRLPWWIFAPTRRVPGTRLRDYVALLKLRTAGPDDLVGDLVGDTGPLYRNLLEPLAIAALNTMPDIAAAAPLRAVLAETIERGGAHTIPRFAKIGLSESFIDPALAYLRAHGAELRFSTRITTLDPAQKTILAVPPWIASTLLPGLTVPDQFESICNLHFKYALPPGAAGFWGFTGSMTEWAFARSEILSVTISAANRYAALDNAEIAEKVWSELAQTFALTRETPAHRVVWERRATLLGTPGQLARRPQTRTQNPKLMLAGDWTATGLPATIEGAIRSGNAAARALSVQ
ncbi:MAG TPA: hydroxysqualene dehydroxylase HpnE [Acidocella sp.]|nr:hydroxysqualene dehydroxylase HpnE [Acidocella sp.]